MPELKEIENLEYRAYKNSLATCDETIQHSGIPFELVEETVSGDAIKALRKALNLAETDQIHIVIKRADRVESVEETPGLHDLATGRLDAKGIARLFGVSLTYIADVAKTKLATISKTPNSVALQPTLRMFQRIAKIGVVLIGSNEGLRIWMNEQNQQLNNMTPLEAIKAGYGEAIITLLDNMMLGQSS